MNGKTVHIKSFGCQMNKLDTALFTTALQDAGFGLADTVKQADVVLINTCSVRDHAEQRVLSHLGHLKHMKKTRPQLVVGVVGCMAQRLGQKLLEHETVDIVCGPTQIPQISRLIEQTLEQKIKTVAVTERIRHKADNSQTQSLEEFESAFGIENKQLSSQAFVRVMRGCDKFCTYCVVPYVRGPEVSRPPEAIVEQIKKLADQGVVHVTLLGQSVNSYKYLTGEKTYCLADLLYMISDIQGIEWIRFVTNYPHKEFLDDILKAMAELPKVCEYLHMPAQSGSDKILKAMNRKYSASEYLDMIERARVTVPGIAISGDFIVGFSDETEEDFQATVDLVKSVRYKNCFIFKYSPRPGTGADKRLLDNIPQNIKKQRNTQLLAVQEQISDELSKQFIGQTVKVLVEGLSKKPHLDASENNSHPQLIGRTESDYIVVFNGPESLAGKFANIKITRSMPLTLFGQIV
jgi:tRNA-2-methylthio-N6-dimethylallyladenosine synthase